MVGLRYREPIFRSLRELAMSYFELYYNLDGEKTLRDYSAPIDLSAYDRLDWQTSDEGLDVVAARTYSVRHHALLTPAMIRGLARVDPRTFEAGLMGANEAGLYKPR